MSAIPSGVNSFKELDQLVGEGKLVCDRCKAKGTFINRINFLVDESLCDNCYMNEYDLRPEATLEQQIKFRQDAIKLKQ